MPGWVLPAEKPLHNDGGVTRATLGWHGVRDTIAVYTLPPYLWDTRVYRVVVLRYAFRDGCDGVRVVPSVAFVRAVEGDSS